jgi:hypothetical protein
LVCGIIAVWWLSAELHRHPGERAGSCDSRLLKREWGSVSASIDLNSFIVNNNGNLVDGAGFVPSCSNIWWFELSTSNQGVAAECRKADGTVGDTTTFIVEARVSNNGGILVFNSCRRRSLLEAVDASAIVGRKMLRV